MDVPFLDLKAQMATIRPEVDAAIGRVLDSTQFIMGDELTAFEREFAAFCGTRECVGVDSGLSALELLATLSLICTAPVSHRSFATVRRGTSRLYFRNKSKRIRLQG